MMALNAVEQAALEEVLRLVLGHVAEQVDREGGADAVRGLRNAWSTRAADRLAERAEKGHLPESDAHSAAQRAGALIEEGLRFPSP